MLLILFVFLSRVLYAQNTACQVSQLAEQLAIASLILLLDWHEYKFLMLNSQEAMWATDELGHVMFCTAS